MVTIINRYYAPLSRPLSREHVFVSVTRFADAMMLLMRFVFCRRLPRCFHTNIHYCHIRCRLVHMKATYY